jgi:Arc/MetJ family transcription regulator
VPGGPAASSSVWQIICHTHPVRTTLDIDDDLMEALMRRLPGKSKTEAIEEAITEFVRADAVRQLQEMAGTVEFDDAALDREADRERARRIDRLFAE